MSTKLFIFATYVLNFLQNLLGMLQRKIFVILEIM